MSSAAPCVGAKTPGPVAGEPARGSDTRGTAVRDESDERFRVRPGGDDHVESLGLEREAAELPT